MPFEKAASRRPARTLAASCILLLAGSAPALRAQGDVVEAADVERETRRMQVVNHFIRPGDTFSTITSKLLGSAREWRRNQELNPDYLERQLQPGERMLVLIDPRRHPTAARVEQSSGNVEAQPAPLDWRGLVRLDLLLEDDATRTGPDSSAQLVVGDGAEITISPESLVFLRRLGDRLTVQEASEIEIVEGQADLRVEAPTATSASAAAAAGVDVVLGTARLQVTGAGGSKLRAGRIDESRAKTSVYEGPAAEFSSSGESIDLAAGTGVVAAAGEPPVPEKLLPPPTDLRPEDGAEVAEGSPVELSWTAAPEPGQSHAGTVVELCRDPGCAQLLQRFVQGTETTRTLAPLPRDDYWWRVTLISASGLDGYPSEPTSLRVVESLPVETDPPRAALALRDRTVPYGDREVVGGAPDFEVTAEDDDSGVGSWRLIAADGPLDELRDPAGLLPSGEYEVWLEVTDVAGNVARSEPLRFVVEGSAPRLEISALEGAATAEAAPADSPDQSASGVLWSLDGISWRPFGDEEVLLLSAPFELQLRGGGRCLRRADADSPRCPGALRITADDPEIGLRSLRARLEGAASGAPGDEAIVVVAADRVGNQSSERLELARP
ncbi:MAG: hypothetical protein DWQ36_13575 [Acidobacteria bacterium]|nr:MAG: hypothetical protein DWQ36_13575 [Acidobacteriota bacterium]